MRQNISLAEISDGHLYKANDMVKADCGGCEGCSQCCRGMGRSIILIIIKIIYYNKEWEIRKIIRKEKLIEPYRLLFRRTFIGFSFALFKISISIKATVKVLYATSEDSLDDTKS